jgi:hypothetical protein
MLGMVLEGDDRFFVIAVVVHEVPVFELGRTEGGSEGRKEGVKDGRTDGRTEGRRERGMEGRKA